MTENQRIWKRCCDSLIAAVTELGFSEELAVLMARELGSPRAIDRMAAYVRLAKPTSEEMLVDEMLAIKSEIETWRERKTSLEAQARYNARLYYGKPGGRDHDAE